MLGAFQIGISLSDYNEMTPYELMVAIKAFQINKQNELDNIISVAWLSEYYHRLKKLMPLDEALSKTKKKAPKKEMTSAEMLKQVQQLNALLGGNVIEKGSED